MAASVASRGNWRGPSRCSRSGVSSGVRVLSHCAGYWKRSRSREVMRSRARPMAALQGVGGWRQARSQSNRERTSAAPAAALNRAPDATAMRSRPGDPHGPPGRRTRRRARHSPRPARRTEATPAAAPEADGGPSRSLHCSGLTAARAPRLADGTRLLQCRIRIQRRTIACPPAGLRHPCPGGRGAGAWGCYCRGAAQVSTRNPRESLP